MPADTTLGIMVGGHTNNAVTLGNVITDDKKEPKVRHGLILRGAGPGLTAFNYVSGSKKRNITVVSSSPKHISTGNIDTTKSK